MDTSLFLNGFDVIFAAAQSSFEQHLLEKGWQRGRKRLMKYFVNRRERGDLVVVGNEGLVLCFLRHPPCHLSPYHTSISHHTIYTIPYLQLIPYHLIIPHHFTTSHLSIPPTSSVIVPQHAKSSDTEVGIPKYMQRHLMRRKIDLPYQH